MKKMFFILLTITFVASLSSISFAGGDKVRGDKGAGPTEQNQNGSPGNQN